jgi:hypothetical protein
MMMTKGLTRKLVLLLILLPLTAIAAGEIYRVVDENGNVTFTDQKPASGGEVVDLPPLSVIETDIQVPAKTAADAEAAAEPAPATPRELRRQFRDFRITQPQNEETFWGTANTVVVSWGSSQEIPPEMSTVLYVDGEPRDVPAAGSSTLTLDRGEHQVYAELRDQRKRRIVTTPTVTFFVKQHSVLFNRPNGSPSG